MDDVKSCIISKASQTICTRRKKMAKTVKIPNYRGEMYLDKRGDWRWRLRCADNGKIVASSAGDGYENKKECPEMFHKVTGNQFDLDEIKD